MEGNIKSCVHKKTDAKEISKHTSKVKNSELVNGSLLRSGTNEHFTIN